MISTLQFQQIIFFNEGLAILPLPD